MSCENCIEKECCNIGGKWCKEFDLKTKKCKIYNNRPQLCRNYYCQKALMETDNQVKENGSKIKENN